MDGEKKLLDNLIERESLGKGEAKFEVNVGVKGPKYIDLVYEKEDEIWLIEAKNILNYEALGQVLSYKELYLQKVISPKNIKLGIACKDSDPDIEQVCKRYGIGVFVLKEERKEPEIPQQEEICGVCGEPLAVESGEYTCKTCEYFFGISGREEACFMCGRKFMHYPAVDDKVLDAVNFPHSNKRKSWRGMCPACRKESEMFLWVVGKGEWSYHETTRKIIRVNIQTGTVTIRDFEMRGIPKEFVEFCLGRRKINV